MGKSVINVQQKLTYFLYLYIKIFLTVIFFMVHLDSTKCLEGRREGEKGRESLEDYKTLYHFPLFKSLIIFESKILLT